jgi:steroid 5-alpha reductase family enzyme
MRKAHGDRWPLEILGMVFMMQAALIWWVSLPVQAAMAIAAPGLGWLDALGALLVAVGVGCEATGDYQLARFKADPANKGRVMDRGLWRYTRHPNYFGDFCVWWGLFAIAVAGGHGLWAIGSPLVMSFLLLRVSGVTLLEKHMADRPGYAEYVRRTRPFFPWPPKA